MTSLVSPCDTHFRTNCELCTTRANNPCRAICMASRSRCLRPLPENFANYPGMCEQHAEEYNVQNLWEQTSEVFQNIILYCVSPDELPSFLLGFYVTSLKVEYDVFIRLMFSPVGFWTLTPEITANLIYLGMVYILQKNPPKTIPVVTYAYMADYIGEILAWLMDGGETVDVRQIKWQGLTELIKSAFILGFARGAERILPRADCGWKSAWNRQFETWLENVGDQEQCRWYWQQFILEIELAMMSDFADAISIQVPEMSQVFDKVIEDAQAVRVHF
jgi:hypothetical protein